MYYRQTTTAGSDFDQGNADVAALGITGFIATQVVVVSFVDMTIDGGDPTLLHTFQIVLVTDYTKTYAILTYDRLNTGDGTVSFRINAIATGFFCMIDDSCDQLVNQSNVGEAGKFVFDLANLPSDLSTAPFPTV